MASEGSELSFVSSVNLFLLLNQDLECMIENGMRRRDYERIRSGGIGNKPVNQVLVPSIHDHSTRRKENCKHMPAPSDHLAKTNS